MPIESNIIGKSWMNFNLVDGSSFYIALMVKEKLPIWNWSTFSCSPWILNILYTEHAELNAFPRMTGTPTGAERGEGGGLFQIFSTPRTSRVIHSQPFRFQKRIYSVYIWKGVQVMPKSWQNFKFLYLTDYSSYCDHKTTKLKFIIQILLVSWLVQTFLIMSAIWIMEIISPKNRPRKQPFHACIYSYFQHRFIVSYNFLVSSTK